MCTLKWMETLGQQLCVSSTLRETVKRFSKVVVPTDTFTSSEQPSGGPMPLPTPDNFYPAGKCEMLSHYGFNFHFLITNENENLFIYLLPIQFSMKCLFKFLILNTNTDGYIYIMLPCS